MPEAHRTKSDEFGLEENRFNEMFESLESHDIDWTLCYAWKPFFSD